MAIAPLDFGKNLRPSTVETMNKLNEVIAAVNDISGEGIDAMKADIATLKTSTSNLETQMVTANENIKTNTDTNATQQTDIDAIKITLYTPLDSSES